jgi:hypothetical protein
MSGQELPGPPLGPALENHVCKGSPNICRQTGPELLRGRGKNHVGSVHGTSACGIHAGKAVPAVHQSDTDYEIAVL